MKNKNILLLFPVILFMTVNLFIATNKIYSQDNSDDDVIIDSIDVKENLLDSNTVYQKDFDSLSNEGEWVKINRADLIKDVNSSDENIVEDDDPTVVKIVYIWRPRNVDYEWNPYSNGRWVFTYRGWIWESDYNWGWACYNYGRWYWSGYYGWCWLPGRVWAPNWCMWRSYNNYCGWYPTCPRIHWRHHGHWVRNHTFKSRTKHWTFVDKKDFTKKVDKGIVVNTDKNSEILKNSQKIKGVNTFITDKKHIKYNGPEVTNISKESGVQIVPVKVKVTKTIDNGITNTTKNPGNNGPRTIRDNGNNNTTKGNNGSTNTTKSPGNNGPTKNPPSNNGPTKNPPSNNGPTKSPPSNNGPTKSPPSNNGPTKSPPSNNGPTKSPPSNNGPTKSNEPKNDGKK